jgi:hypothetical protein
MLLALVSLVAACVTIAPPKPRFIAVFEQRSEFCQIQVLQDTRSQVCFVAFRCARQPVQVLEVGEDVCVP